MKKAVSCGESPEEVEGEPRGGPGPSARLPHCPRPRDSRSPGSPRWPRGGRQGIHLNSSTSPTHEARRKSRPAPTAPAAPPRPYPRGQDPKLLPPPPAAERGRGH